VVVAAYFGVVGGGGQNLLGGGGGGVEELSQALYNLLAGGSQQGGCACQGKGCAHDGLGGFCSYLAWIGGGGENLQVPHGMQRTPVQGGGKNGRAQRGRSRNQGNGEEVMCNVGRQGKCRKRKIKQ